MVQLTGNNNILRFTLVFSTGGAFGSHTSGVCQATAGANGNPGNRGGGVIYIAASTFNFFGSMSVAGLNFFL